jgi:hypothetical protein
LVPSNDCSLPPHTASSAEPPQQQMKTKGRHPDKALTAVGVRTAKQAGRYADGNGLYLVVDPSGAKRWLLRTVVHSRRRDIGLGGVRLVTLAEAREKALQYRKLARDGGDPVAEKRKSVRVVPTFADAARVVHAEHMAVWKNRKHAAQWINTLTQYVFPLLGSHRIDQIDTLDVLKVLLPSGLPSPRRRDGLSSGSEPFWIGRRRPGYDLEIIQLMEFQRGFRSRLTVRHITPHFPTQRFPVSCGNFGQAIVEK